MPMLICLCRRNSFVVWLGTIAAWMICRWIPTLAFTLGSGSQRKRRHHRILSHSTKETAIPVTTSPGRTCVIAYHKPVHVVATKAVDDVLGRRNVFQDLMARSCPGWALPPDFPGGWHTVGRLDAETTGLLLLTNDGGLVHRVTNKNVIHDGSIVTNGTTSHTPVEKTYEACIMGYYSNDSDMMQLLRLQGVNIGAKYGGQTLPVHHLQVLGHPTSKSTLVSLSLVEGKNRQVRRMFHALGSGVMKLKRTAIGTGLMSLSVSTLVPNQGDWCFLSDDQVISTLQYTPRQLSTGSNGSLPSRGRQRHATTAKRQR